MHSPVDKSVSISVESESTSDGSTQLYFPEGLLVSKSEDDDSERSRGLLTGTLGVSTGSDGLEARFFASSDKGKFSSISS